jgi:hypothetical protein
LAPLIDLAQAVVRFVVATRAHAVAVSCGVAAALAVAALESGLLFERRERHVGAHIARSLANDKAAAREVAVVESPARLIIGHPLPKARVHVHRQALMRIVTDILERGVAHLHVAHGQGAGDFLGVARRCHQTGDGLQPDLARVGAKR